MSEGTSSDRLDDRHDGGARACVPRARSPGIAGRLHAHYPMLATLALMAVLGTVTTLGGVVLWHQELRDREVHAQAILEHTVGDITAYLGERELALAALAGKLSRGDGVSVQTLAREAGALRARLPGIDALAWIDRAGEIRLMAPAGTVRAAKADGLAAELALPDLAREAARDGMARMTAPFRLASGAEAVILLAPAGTGEDAGGLLGAVLPLDDLMRGDPGDGYSAQSGVEIHVGSGAPALASATEPLDAPPATRHIGLFGQDWTLVADLPGEGPRRLVMVTALLLATVLALAVLVGWLLKERQRLSRNQFEFDLILNNTALRILYKDDKNRILRLNDAAARFHGLTVEQATGKSGYEIFPKYAKQRHEEDLATIRSGKTHFGDVKEMGRADGVTLWGRADKIPYKDPFTGDDRLLMVATDVSEQVNAERALRRSEERYNLAIEMSSLGTWDWDVLTGELYWSPRNREIVGITDPAFEPTYADFKDRLHPDDLARVTEARRAHLEDRKPYLIEFRLRHESGSYVWIRARGQAVWDEDGKAVRMAGSNEDITERVNLQQRLTHLAHHDALTGLLNRVLFREHLGEACARAEAGETVALLCIDLDGFKAVNDTLGHGAGDKQLTLVAGRLCGCIGPSDTLARLGGDEFAIVHSSGEVLRTASMLAMKVIEAISAPYEIEASQTVIGASVGIAIAPRDGTDADRLMNNADLALYCAKQEGRGGYRFFESEMESSIKERKALGIDLTRALANRELAVVYQPLVNVASGEISGFEALVRWHHPERGEVAPSEFIPVAEECGLINQIGEWVLVEACREAASWPRHLKIAVNVSPVQFRGGMLMLTVVQALSKSGLGTNRLELEITESVLLEDNDVSLAILHQLHDLGVRISLDDFGTGYSSLSYLQRFPFDKIKIDSSFIAHIGEDDDDLGIVHAVVSLANRLGVETTAEGVETEEQLEVVRTEGCTEMQGYLFSPPRTAEEIAGLFLEPMRAMADTA